MTEPQKDTIYIDIDDEITSIIDKIQGSSNKVVALVLPKRATVLQSIVNMKLLKRAGEQANKNLVLVTTESSLMPLAGAVGLHVAKTPTSRPEIPAGPTAASDALEEVDEIDLDDEVAAPVSAKADGNRPVGDLAGATMPLPAKPKNDSGVETLELDNTTPVAAAAAAKAKPVVPKPKKDKKLQVPDFNKFRLALILGGVVVVLLIVFGYFAFNVLPKATINVKTNASNVNTDVDFTLSTAATSFNESTKTVPAKRVETQKTLTGTASATGQKNNGDKADGEIDMSICTNNPNATSAIPSGSAVSSGGKTYITQESADFQFNGNCNGGFRFRATDVEITAQSGGSQFNVNNADFKVSGRPDITATGSATGGTDDIQTVVSQSDIDSAKGKIAATANSDVQDELKQELEDQGMYAITATYTAAEPATTTSSKVGDQTSNVTVTQVITYSMLGANVANIKTLVDNDIKDQIDTSLQSILNQGITQGSFKVSGATTNGAAMNVQTTAIVGPALDTDAIASQAAGKKSGEIKSEVGSNEGVTEVEVKMSPFWVSKAPKNTSKITVVIAKPTNTANDN